MPVTPPRTASNAPSRGGRWPLIIASGAAATVVAAAGAVIATGDDPADAVERSASPTAGGPSVAGSAATTRSAADDASLEERAALRRRAAAAVSRSEQRSAPSDRGESRAKSGNRSRLGKPAVTKANHDGSRSKSAARVAQNPRDIARSMLGAYGWDGSQYGCLDQLWIGESGWDHTATNPTSGAYGIPQSLPADKMASAGADWRTNPATQIEWGLEYINLTYGSPCAANSFKAANNWY